MKFSVTLSSQAYDELQEAYEWLSQQTELHAPNWYNGLVDAVLSLEDNPTRCPRTSESSETSEETRQLLYGNRRHAYRIVFAIREQTVWVLHIQHAARK